MFRKIKEVRIAKGMTQKELAEKSGVSRVTILELENGTKTSTTTDTLCSIANALSVSVTDLFFTGAAK